jgi:hypothetical protein
MSDNINKDRRNAYSASRYREALQAEAERRDAQFTKVKSPFSELEKHITAIRKKDYYGDFKPYSEGDIDEFGYRNCSCVLDDGNIVVLCEEWYKDYHARAITACRDYINLKGFQTFEDYLKSKGFVADDILDEKGTHWQYRGNGRTLDEFCLRYRDVDEV